MIDLRVPSAPACRAIVIRTHYIDAFVLGIARSLSGHPDYAVLFAVDETGGVIDAAEFPKVVVNAGEFQRLGLPTDGQNEVWRCGDYILYLVRDAHPEFESVWLLENDALVNRDDPLSFFIEIDRASDHDLLATYVHATDASWFWHKTMAASHDVVFRCFFPVVRLSSRGIDFLLSQRQAEARHLAESTDYHLIANDEAFVATKLVANGFTAADFNQFGETYTTHSFSYEGLFHPDDLPRDGLLYHPVRVGARYLQRALLRPAPDPRSLVALMDKACPDDLPAIESPLRTAFERLLTGLGDNPERILGHSAILPQVLARLPHAGTFRAAARALGAAHLPFCLTVLGLQAAAAGLEVDLLDNLALGRPAWQSSICTWSPRQNHRHDAEGANDGDRDVAVGFHTNEEPEPWWTVDLMRPIEPGLVRIFNRAGLEDRMNGFRLLTSLDGLEWTDAYRHPPDHEAERIIEVSLAGVAVARYVRVQLTAVGVLHFSEFEIYGRKAATPGVSGAPAMP